MIVEIFDDEIAVSSNLPYLRLVAGGDGFVASLRSLLVAHEVPAGY